MLTPHKNLTTLLEEAIPTMRRIAEIHTELEEVLSWGTDLGINNWDDVNKLNVLLHKITCIDDEAHVINANFRIRREVLKKSLEVGGLWPHHFKVDTWDECEGHTTYCQRCNADNRYDNLDEIQCRTYAHGIPFPTVDPDDIPF